MLLGSIFVGNFGSLGNVTVVGFMKAFPAEVVVGFGSGTGLAGIFGSGLVLAARSFGISFVWVILCHEDLHRPDSHLFHVPLAFLLDHTSEGQD